MSDPAAEKTRLQACMRPAGLLLALSALGGCAAMGPSAPAGPMTWVRYVSGEDLRAQCRPAEPARLRMIHTVPGADRIRTFDLRETDEGASMEAHSILISELARLAVDEPLGPLHPEGPVATLSRTQFAALVGAVKAAGLKGGISTGSQEPTGSYWFANGCHDGAWFIAIVAAKNPFEDAAFGLRGAPTDR